MPLPHDAERSSHDRYGCEYWLADGRRGEAAELWRQSIKFWKQLEGQPLLQEYCVHARHQVAKMQNTLDSLGDEDKNKAGMVAIDAERDEMLAVLRPAIEALPNFASLDESANTQHTEPSRIFGMMQLRVPEGLPVDELTHAMVQQLDIGDGVEFDIQAAEDTLKRCEACGKQTYLGTKVDKGRSPAFETVQLLACAACEKVYYCGKACQKSHWKVHKPSCVPRECRREEVNK